MIFVVLDCSLFHRTKLAKLKGFKMPIAWRLPGRFWIPARHSAVAGMRSLVAELIAEMTCDSTGNYLS
jgi:hypothetical protein